MTIEAVFMIVLALFGIALFASVLKPDGGAFINGIEPCPPHKWKYDEKGLMVCDKCSKPPFSD